MSETPTAPIAQPTLARLRMSVDDWQALARNGFVAAEFRFRGGRRCGPYFRLHWRAGRQRSRYLGMDPHRAEQIRAELDAWQSDRQQTRRLAQLLREVRTRLYRVKDLLAPAVAERGWTFHGYVVRRRGRTSREAYGQDKKKPSTISLCSTEETDHEPNDRIRQRNDNASLDRTAVGLRGKAADAREPADEDLGAAKRSAAPAGPAAREPWHYGRRSDAGRPANPKCTRRRPFRHHELARALRAAPTKSRVVLKNKSRNQPAGSSRSADRQGRIGRTGIGEAHAWGSARMAHHRIRRRMALVGRDGWSAVRYRPRRFAHLIPTRFGGGACRDPPGFAQCSKPKIGESEGENWTVLRPPSK
jgi:hypothetical protein